MPKESQDWIFVNRIPLMCEKDHIIRQQKIEIWLDLYQLKHEIELAQAELQQLSMKEYVS